VTRIDLVQYWNQMRHQPQPVGNGT
jgi:hypothetical protein